MGLGLSGSQVSPQMGHVSEVPGFSGALKIDKPPTFEAHGLGFRI